jgi:hypothetical protein
MSCIEKIYSVSALVGDGTCNAKCKFCAGCVHRKDSQQASENFQLRANFEKNLESAIKLSARHGGWSLSLTSAGEPTMCPDDVTTALIIYQKCASQGAYMPNVNLFTNGILLGNQQFCQKWLPIWRDLGLNNICLSIHSIDRQYQAQAYGFECSIDYPSFESIINNVRSYGLGFRATVLLNKKIRPNDNWGGIGTCSEFVKTIEYLTQRLKVDNITTWPIGNPDGSRNEFTPSRWELFKIKSWLALNAKKCHGHVWGGGVYDYGENIIRLTDYVTPHDPKKNYVRQLVVFPKGEVHYSWVKQGSICIK